MRRGRGTWLQEQLSDPYVKRAHREGARSRALYKLSELLNNQRLIRPGMNVVDLGAAPGGWSQHVAKLLDGDGRVVAVDLLEMPTIAGVHFLQGDFREQDVLDAVLEALGGAPANLVMSDMAPNLSGQRAVDQPRAMYLAELALDFAQRTLAPGGALIVKLFQGEGFDEYLRTVRQQFAAVKNRKPAASRSRSREMYLVARDFKGA
ncbi:MAG: 23S rRNA (uridine(2552)-2'-O)-methyltransferase RlmE [Pseudomonadota bacterium]